MGSHWTLILSPTRGDGFGQGLYHRPVSTRRQRIIALLEEDDHGFEELREELGVPVHVLEEDLGHVEKTVRSAGRRLRVEPPRCFDCGFVFKGRGTKHFHAPSRCPKCRSEAISDPRMRVR